MKWVITKGFQLMIEIWERWGLKFIFERIAEFYSIFKQPLTNNLIKVRRFHWLWYLEWFEEISLAKDTA